MAHELEFVNGQAQMAYVGATPWHGLGVSVEDNLTPEEMMKAAGCDWEVKEVEAFVEFKGKKIFTGQKSLVRETDGRILTNVGKDWFPVQNKAAFEFFNDFVEAGQMKMHTAGSLKNGEIIWALAKVDDSFELFNGDKVESYFLFSNPHQYGKTIDIRFTPIRVVCNNTLSMSINQQVENSVRLSHRRAFDADAVKEMMGIAHFKLNQYKETAEFLGSKVVKRDVMAEYFGELLGRSNKDETKLSRRAEMAMSVLETQPGAEFAEGTMWQAFNAVTYLVDHKFGRSQDTRLTSAWYGSNRKLKVDALKLAVDMVEVA